MKFCDVEILKFYQFYNTKFYDTKYIQKVLHFQIFIFSHRCLTMLTDN